jgi:hypothetical protein
LRIENRSDAAESVYSGTGNIFRKDFLNDNNLSDSSFTPKQISNFLPTSTPGDS